jgi:DNA-binding helix-hairpin-helix protein with protein kinase domain
MSVPERFLASGELISPGQLTAGVQADVYLTRRTSLVVVKVVHAPADGDDPRLRPHNAAREARLLTRLKHPNVRSYFLSTKS